MKKKFVFLVLYSFIYSAVNSQAQIILVTETFDNGSNPITFDSTGPGTNSGNNNWIINALYNGQPLYQNTPPEDSVVSGTISHAPHSTYLHIHDVAATTSNSIGNDNWAPNKLSDHFCYLSNSFCTMGMSSVVFEFFWICQGNSSAYGEVYYRADGGAWTKTGQTKYNNQVKWKFEQITDPAFVNVQNLQFGFRWVNPGTGGAANLAFGIDDIIAVGNFANSGTGTAVTLHTQVFNSQVCAGDPVLIQTTLSSVLCDGNYQIQMSDSSGDFTNCFDLADFQLQAPNSSAFGYTTNTSSAISGSCFRVRTVRTTLPVITGDTSACFKINKCAGTITKVKAPVMEDADTTCIQSVIDVSFNSTRQFLPGNDYIAELSGPNGKFDDSTLLGTLHLTDSFPSNAQGTIAGSIPASVLPGCGYYIRVRSTNPPVVSSPIGPYCLVRCDEFTNNGTDMHFCIQSPSYPACNTLNIAPDHWHQGVTYNDCNSWKIELRSMGNFSLVNSGGLGIYTDKTGGNYNLCMPSSKSLLPVLPGDYYMRIVSSSGCSSQSWNTTGTVIRVSIGAPDSSLSLEALPDSVICAGTAYQPNLLLVQLSPYDAQSHYLWSTDLYNNGVPFEYDFPSWGLYIAESAPIGEHQFYVDESSFGCYGPSSKPLTITIIGKPDVNITGPSIVCTGDTISYHVDFQKETFYQWETPVGARQIDTSNNEALIVFDSIGVYNIYNYSLNACGADNNSYKVASIPSYIDLTILPNLQVCKGDSIDLALYINKLSRVFVSDDTGKLNNKQGGMFNIIAHGDVIIDSFAIKLLSQPNPLEAEIYGKQGTYKGFETTPLAWNLLAQNLFITPTGQKFTTISAPVEQPMQNGDTFAFYISTVNTPAVHIAYNKGSGLQETLYKTNGIIDFIQGTLLDYPFKNNVPDIGYVLNTEIFYSTKAGLKYSWNTGDTTSVINFTYSDTGSYHYLVSVSDLGACRVKDSVNVKVENCIFPTGVDLTTNDDLFNVFPNPSTGKIFFQTAHELLKITIYDVQGRKVWESAGLGKITDISGLNDGEYILTALTAENVWRKKLILLR